MAGRAADSGGGQADESSLAEPHELRDAERTFLKLLELTRRGVLPAKLLPAVSNLQTALSGDPCSRCHLLSLSHDELGVIFEGLADPLQPELAVVFSSTCKGLRTPLRVAFDELECQHFDAKAMCYLARYVFDAESESFSPMSCAMLADEDTLCWNSLAVDTPVVMIATLGMILRTNGLPKLRYLDLSHNQFGDAGAQALFDGLGPGSLPSLRSLNISGNNIRPAGVEALVTALSSGAMPKLEELYLCENVIGNQGVAALAPALKKLPALKVLDLGNDGIGDEGLASLLDNLGKDDFKKLTRLYLDGNLLTDKGCATIVAALKAGALPALKACELISDEMHASEEACAAVKAALQQRLG